jgi:hypothetical protein
MWNVASILELDEHLAESLVTTYQSEVNVIAAWFFVDSKNQNKLPCNKERLQGMARPQVFLTISFV